MIEKYSFFRDKREIKLGLIAWDWFKKRKKEKRKKRKKEERNKQ